MRLESALYASREGISAHGSAISVVGDNIANANTTGFKESRVEFTDLLSDGIGGGDPGVGPSGDGVKVSKVRPVLDTGVLEATGRVLDAAIDGNGYFMVGEAGNPQYARAGAFVMAGDGTLQTGDGLNVLGFGPGGSALTSLNLLNITTTAVPTTSANVFGNLDSSAEISAPLTGATTIGQIGRQANFLAGVTTYDSLGNDRNLTLAFYKTAPNSWTVQGYADGADIAGGTAGTPVLLGSQTLTFQNNGLMNEAAQAAATLNLQPAFADGAAAGNITINLSQFSQYSGSSQITSLTQNGQGAGSIDKYEFREDGGLFAQLDTGQSVLVGTVKLADFANRDGLVRAGSSTFTAGDESGTRSVGSPGEGVFGKLKGGVLERSTVDLADQFVDLVVFQRGYQASSQTLQAASRLLEQTISLIR
jgi:flagellar hook protein FlgE